VGGELTATEGNILNSYATRLNIENSICMIVAENSRAAYHLASAGFSENANGSVSVLVHHNQILTAK
jgi:hypothetical protein